MQDFKLAVFDVDGTLLDTTEGVLAAVRYTIQKHGLKELPEEDLRTFIGPPIQNSFSKYYGIEGEELQELATTFRNRYKDVDLFKAVPYEGIFDVLDQLVADGVKIAVATYKRQDYALSILKHFGFDKYSDIMYGADHFNKLKKSDIIELCLKDANIEDYTEAVMIGDSDNDAIGAEKLGIPFIGVTYGFGFKTEEDLSNVVFIGVANSPEQLQVLLKRK